MFVLNSQLILFISGKLEQTVSDGCENGVVELYLAYKDNLLIAHCIEPGLPTAYRLQVIHE